MSVLAKREENGAKGESLTQSILLSRFWVMKRSADVDGADFLVQRRSDSLEALRQRAHGIDIFGIIQSKYFENSNRVDVQKSYVLDDGIPRKDFFCMLHSHDEEEEPLHYFFSAEDIVKEFNLSPCEKFYWFALTSSRQYNAYKNKKQKFILDKIELGMFQTEGNANKKFIKNKLTAYARPTMHFQDKPNFEYAMKIFDDVRVVIIQDMAGGSRRLLEPRRDLFENQGDYYWGDDDTGCHFLAVSMLAHHLNGESPGDAAVRQLREHLQKLDEESSYVIRSETLQEFINSPVYVSNRLQDLEGELPINREGLDIAFFEVVSLLGTELKIKCRDGIESVLDIKGCDYMKAVVDTANIFTRGIESSGESTKRMMAIMLHVERDPGTKKVFKIYYVYMIRIVD
ncbi:hypothetical protein KKI90_20390 [Xenorhabdus bovienii]|uniref:hypothetical protein n=1 Tax=Xenorhabdus bovienii TaxID=40576 RepID=UPI00237D18DD|nr:hypothetical protein [Xenorhabdus bovienii]MDE1483386.1 hypothetical protein [Xenorhabdus bovienii]MDE1488635.1 hypothetical protein [Xenorhabdus bovienii]MDE9442467.1 hypothetical protein [Xenorhabdus bovienii]MDE9479479.1 hypothetical protein [Xenorhabdus bovienii]MDE9532373.1 hypothetical protein [Xenorhabdus bovienii]